MAINESRLRQIIREEARKMMESERTPRGLPTRRGEPRDMDPNRDVAYGRGEGGYGFGRTMGGRDEQWGDEDDDGTGWDFNYQQKWRKGDRALYGRSRRPVVVTRASEVGPDVEFDYEDDGSHGYGHADDLKRA